MSGYKPLVMPKIPLHMKQLIFRNLDTNDDYGTLQSELSHPLLAVLTKKRIVTSPSSAR